MTVERGNQWRCDTCGTTMFKSGYGLPNGWAWRHPSRIGEAITHQCDTCSTIQRRLDAGMANVRRETT